jgi:hypothetical protein
MGVFVASLWQSFLALAALSMVLMSKENNPVWKYYAMKLAEKLRLKPDPKLAKTLAEVNAVLREEEQAAVAEEGDSGVQGSRDQGGVAGAGSLVAGGSPSSNSGLPSANEAAPVRNDRPKRFVYGEKKGH